MLDTINLSATMRTAIDRSLEHLRTQGLRRFAIEAQRGDFLFCTATITDDHYIEALLHERLQALEKVGYVPLVITERSHDRQTVIERGRKVGAQAMLHAASHERIAYRSGGEIRHGILRRVRPFILFDEQLALVAAADPGSAMHVQKWQRAARQWLSLAPTRRAAGAT